MLHVLFVLVVATLMGTGAAQWIDFADQQYYVDLNTYTNFSDAAASCREKQSTLAVVESLDVLDFLVKEIGNLTDEPHTFYIAVVNMTENDNTTDDDDSNSTCSALNKLNIPGEINYTIRSLSCFASSRTICQRNVSLQTTQVITSSAATITPTTDKTTTHVDSDATTAANVTVTSLSTQPETTGLTTVFDTSDVPVTTSNGTTTKPPSSGELTQKQVIIISAVGACVGTLLVVIGCFLLWRVTRGRRKSSRLGTKRNQALSVRNPIQKNHLSGASSFYEPTDKQSGSEGPDRKNHQADDELGPSTKESYEMTKLGPGNQKSLNVKNSDSTDVHSPGQREGSVANDKVPAVPAAIKLKRRASLSPDFYGSDDIHGSRISEQSRRRTFSFPLKRDDTLVKRASLSQDANKDGLKNQSVDSADTNGSININSSREIDATAVLNIQESKAIGKTTNFPDDEIHADKEKVCNCGIKDESSFTNPQETKKVGKNKLHENVASAPQPSVVKLRHGELEDTNGKRSSKGWNLHDTAIAKGVRRLSETFRKSKMFEVVFTEDTDDNCTYLTMTGSSPTKAQEQQSNESDNIYTSMSQNLPAGGSHKTTPHGAGSAKQKKNQKHVTKKQTTAPIVRPAAALFRKPVDPYVSSRMPWQDPEDSQDYVEMFPKTVGQDSVYTDMRGNSHSPNRSGISGSGSVVRSQTQKAGLQHSTVEQSTHFSVMRKQKHNVVNLRHDDDYVDVSTLPRSVSHVGGYSGNSPERPNNSKGRHPQNSNVSPYRSGVTPHVRNW